MLSGEGANWNSSSFDTIKTEDVAVLQAQDRSPEGSEALKHLLYVKCFDCVLSTLRARRRLKRMNHHWMWLCGISLQKNLFNESQIDGH